MPFFGLLSPVPLRLRLDRRAVRSFRCLLLWGLLGTFLACEPPAFKQPCRRASDCRAGETCLPGLSLCTKPCSSSSDCGCLDPSLLSLSSASPSASPLAEPSCPARCVLFPSEGYAFCLRTCRLDSDCPASFCRPTSDTSGVCF